MKMIEEAANGYYDCESIETFKKGVEFAQRWIPVEEELPIELVDIILTDDFEDFDKGYYDEGKWYIYNEFSSISLNNVKGWKPINYNKYERNYSKIF